MDKTKRFCIFASMALLVMGMLLVAAWDMHQAAAAPGPDAWYQGADAPTPVLFYGQAQCIDDPDRFFVIGSYPGAIYFYAYDASANTWETLLPFPISIERSAVVCYGGKIYAAGGNSASAAVDTLYIYDFAAGTWTQGSHLPHPLKQAAVGVWSGRIYLVGGTHISLPWTPLNHVDTYDIFTDTWTDQAQTPMPFAASSAGYAQVGRYLYVVGGWSGDFNQNVNRTQRLDMVTGEWQAGPDFTSARAAFDLVASESRLYAMGGDADGGDQTDATDLVESLDLSTWPDGIWVDIADPLPLPLEGNGGFCSDSVSGGEIWSIGGSDGVSLFPYVYYRPIGEACPELDYDGWIKDEIATLPEPMVGYSVQCPNQPNIIYLVGGVVGTETSNRLYRYDAAASGPWVRLADMPLPLRGQSVACYDDKIYVAGGLADQMNRLFIYDIADDTWTQGAILPNPTGGANLGAWDGKLYLIGGSRQGGLPYTPIPRVDVYDIAANTWTAGGGTNMPTSTAYAYGVQRGSLFYIAGGISGDPNNNVSQTQVYDMANDAWKTLPDLPSQRGINAMATSSTSLYVLGGDENGGGYFDPSSLVETLDLITCPDCQWADFDDPLPRPSVLTTGACTEAKTGGEIWAISGADEELYPYTEVYYHPTGVPCVQYILNLSDAPMVGEGEAGSTLTYTMDITNTGNITDYYKLVISGDWPTYPISGELGPVEPGETIQVVIGVDVPPDARPGEVGVSDVRVESMRDPNLMDSIELWTTAKTTFKPYLSPETMEQSGIYGEIITYTLTVSNGGNITDTLSLTYTGSTWEVSLPFESIELAPAESAQVVLTVTIPGDVGLGEINALILTVISAGDPAASDSTTLTTTAFWYRNLMPVAMRN